MVAWGGWQPVFDSCATLGLPVTGYGLRYHFGMFHQHIENGYQVEDPTSGCVTVTHGRSKRP